ncbi:MAG TPA: hemerythrin domain-containing protein [Propionibacteriaceae bacterium]|jgi:hypothetical protein
MRSLADQTIQELGGPLSVLSRQKADHVKLDRLLTELQRTSPDGQDRVLRRIYRLVFPHAFAEESVLWPVLRRSLADGPELTLRIEQEHQQVNELVTALEQLPLSAPERPATLRRLVEVLSEDVRDEEDRLLPRLQEKAGTAQLRRLGVAWELVRRVSPTRAHPVVARRPPGNVIAAVPLSVVDRLRDLVDLALQHGPEGTRPLLTTTSRALTRLSHGVEKLPLMSRGEHPSTSRV